MRRWGQTPYLAQVMLLPRAGGCHAVLNDNAYYFTLTLVTLLPLGVEGTLYFQPVCATRQYNLLLLRCSENRRGEKSIIDCLAT